MMLSITKAIHDIANKKFKALLKSGAFPKVNYEDNGWGCSYSLFDYSDTWATFIKVIDERMKVSLDTKLGVFTRKRSAPFLNDVFCLIDKVTEEDVNSCPGRFHSFADDVRAEAMK